MIQLLPDVLLHIPGGNFRGVNIALLSAATPSDMLIAPVPGEGSPAGLLVAIGDIMTKVPSAVRLRDRHHGRLKARANRLFTSIS